MDGGKKKVDTLTLFTGLRPERSHSGAEIRKKEFRSIFQLVLDFSAAQARNGFDETNIHGVGGRPNDAAPVAVPS